MGILPKCHQRLIREAAALTPDVDEDEKREAALSFDNAVVEEIDYQTAKAFIIRYEWLQSMGTTVRAIGLYFKHPMTGNKHLAGVNCFGHPGTTTILNLCGEEHSDKVYWLARGACAHWAHPHSGSHLITAACKLMGKPWKTRDGKDMPPKFVFVATADSDAGEIGQLYSSCNWTYIGKTTSDRMFIMPGQPKEKAKSYRVLVKGVLRNRTGRIEKADPDGRRHYLIDGQKYYHKDVLPTGELLVGSPAYPFRLRPEYAGLTQKEAEAKRLAEVLAEGYIEIRGNAKHMFVGIYPDSSLPPLKMKAQRKVLLGALLKNKKLDTLPDDQKGTNGGLKYPKRDTV